MTAEWIFLCGLILVVGVSLAALRHLQTPLLKILTDLCGTEDRARFWLAFSNVTLLGIPTIFALHQPAAAPTPPLAIFDIADQLQSGLAGLILSVVILGFVLSHFISHRKPQEDKP
ncbi:MAG TPA: hypothetical protein VLY23_08400 [Candidatus Acidoferrum sp.]|nr:hypothetical protein [Candidatus Acidoferrum sp.]